MGVNGIVILNMVLSVIAIILFAIGYRQKKLVTARYKKNNDYFKSIIDGGKFNYLFVTVILGRFVPIMVFLQLIFTYVYGVDKINVVSIFVKIAVSIVAGFIYGTFEWNFMNNLYNRNKEAFSSVKFISYYLFFNGVIAWGLMIATALCYYPHEALIPAMVQFGAWLFAGLFFGYVDWSKNRLGYANYIKGTKSKNVKKVKVRA